MQTNQKIVLIIENKNRIMNEKSEYWKRLGDKWLAC